MADGEVKPPPDETPTNPAADAAAQDAALQKQCDEEHATYLKERDTLTKNELETEKGYDTLLVTLSTLAIGSSFTILKDVVRSHGGSSLIILAWIALGACLFIALADKLFSYWTHKWFREALDAEMLKVPWTPGALDRARAQHGNIRFMWFPPKLKITAFMALLAGLAFLLLFVFFATGAPTTDDRPQPTLPVVVNVYNGAPTTAPTVPLAPAMVPIPPAPKFVPAPTLPMTVPTTNRAADASAKP